MNLHATRLESLCRTCGNKIICKGRPRQPKSVEIYAKDIKNLFDVDIANDEISVHPKLICESCRKQFEYARKHPNITTDRPLITYLPHQNTNCQVCQVKTIKLKPISLHSVEQNPSSSKSSNEWLTSQLIESKCKEHSLHNFSSFQKSNSYCIGKMEIINDVPKITMSLNIFQNYTWTFYAFHRKIESFDFLPRTLEPSNIDDLLKCLTNHSICIGNNDFTELIQNKEKCESNFFDKIGNVTAKLESSDLQPIDSANTIRHVDCEVVIPKETQRCNPCSKYRKNLNMMCWRKTQSKEKPVNVPHKYTPNTFLTKDQLISKSEKLSKEVRNLRRSVSKHETFVSKLIEQEGKVLTKDLHEICKKSIQESHDKSPFADDSPQFLLWEQQKKQASLRDPKSMKWHPVMIRWCMSIYLKSPGAYEQLRHSGFICLPHKNTILKYANYTDPKCGINIDVLKKLNELTKDFNGISRVVGIVFDEIKIKSGLIYSRHDGRVIGFSDLGDINNELQEFKNRVENTVDHPPIATHILTLMVRGVCSSLKFPFAYYAGQGFTSDQLFPCIWEAVNLTVIFITSDGASPNRRFYKLHLMEDKSNISEEGVVYWCWNLFSSVQDRRKLYFICDVPHLIKTCRNNFENSHSHNNTRNLMVNGYQISWQHIISLLDYDMGENKSTPGLRQTKLTTDHVFLTPPLRMNVSLAAQVLSNSVAVCMAMQNANQTVETIRFVRMFDKFFDCLNVKSNIEGKMKRKPNSLPYTTDNDARLTWLGNEFLGYLNSWQQQTQEVIGLSKDERNKLCLSQQTLDGLRITVRSFVEMVPYLLKSGAKYVLSDKLNQDPLEEHFGKQRMKGGSRENPTVQDYQFTELKLQAGADPSLRVLRGNTRGRKEQSTIDISDETPLQKKSKKQ